MPQIFIKYSSNIAFSEVENISPLIHKILVNKLPTRIENCITSFLKIDNFKIADTAELFNGFIQCEIKILTGRSEDIKRAICKNIIEYMEKNFIKENFKIKIFVAITEQPQAYVTKII